MLNKNQQEEVKNEMRLISQKCASIMKKMEPLSREIVFSTYKSIKGFEEPMMKAAFEKHKLIKKWLYLNTEILIIK